MIESTAPPVLVERLEAREARAMSPALAAVLIDCVEGGASVGFMAPLVVEKAERYWDGVAGAVEAGATILWAARVGEGGIVGTVQLQPAKFENQPHRADVAKLLVRREARRSGIGGALMEAAERHALSLGRTTLVLDTASDDAERLYQRRGWQLCGTIPRYALNPDGTFCDTKVYWKRLG